MNESTVLFGAEGARIGVVTNPVRDANGIAVVFLNAGFTHHVGPQRMYVEFARRLADHGYTSMRFDYSGIGDSPLRRGSASFADRAVAEAVEAMDHVESCLGVSRFVLFGVCWGADNALRVAAVDRRVVGVVAIDPYAVMSTRYFLRFYGRRLLRPASWVNVVRGKSAVFGRAAQWLRSLRVSTRPTDDDDRLPLRSPGQVLAEMNEMMQRGVRLCLAYATVGGAYDRYVLDFRRPLSKHEAAGRVHVRVFDDTDHVFTAVHSRQQLWEYVEEWSESLPRAV